MEKMWQWPIIKEGKQIKTKLTSPTPFRTGCFGRNVSSKTIRRKGEGENLRLGLTEPFNLHECFYFASQSLNQKNPIVLITYFG